jgi:molybdopterin-binding protein
MRFRNDSFPKRFPSAGAASPRRAIFLKEHVMRISARNQLKGKILEVKKGATTAHVRLEIAPGQVITSSITNEAVDELGLKVGGTAVAIIKASSVMIAVD